MHYMCDLKNEMPTDRLPWNVLSTGVDGGFDNETGVFTAPVHGLYLVILVHFQIGIRPTTIRLMLSEQHRWRDRAMITTQTTNENEYVIGERRIIMSAGDTFCLSLPEKGCLYEIPVFSCVRIGCAEDVRRHRRVRGSSPRL